MSDAQIYNKSKLKECLENGTIGFPNPDQYPMMIKTCHILSWVMTLLDHEPT
ncbi:hypothetical protein DPMN_007291 [Dreissena polymorpha]|uniref:Uncharacterized protein n=1 Tax=Dreissena polymorpha TaxID=45954 RepID=A0A9D4RVW6_DREPO|nr:hypothetical protein DPMN_007291 [Dreissena polymorpha]